MRILNIEAITVQVELRIPNCIALFVARAYACDDGHAESDYPLTEALGNALLGQALAAHAIEQGDPPCSLHGMWEKWAPSCTYVDPLRQTRMPRWLPLAEQAAHNGGAE